MPVDLLREKPVWMTPSIAQAGKMKKKASLPFHFWHIQKTYAYDTFPPYVRSESF